MKKYVIVLLFLNGIASFAETNTSGELPQGLTEEEKLRMDVIHLMGRQTDPPSSPVRNIAEFERMEGVLIRYPFGISVDLISEMAEDITVYCLVSSSQENSGQEIMGHGGL